MAECVIGIVGPIASGKGTVIELLKKRGFFASSTSDRIREEIKKRNGKISRESLTKVSNELRMKYGNDILAKRTAEIIDSTDAKKVVIDAIRNPAEIEFFKKKYNIVMISVSADQEKRYDLFSSRAENSQPMTLEQFKTLDNTELQGTNGSHAQRVQDCILLANYTIENNGSKKELEEKVQQLLDRLQIN